MGEPIGSAAGAVLAEHSHGVGAPATTRAQLLRSRDVADFPIVTGREEEWRFTPIRRLRGLSNGTFVPAPVGLSYHSLSIPDGVTVTCTPRESAQFGAVLTPFDRVSAQAMTSATDAVTVEVAPNAAPTEPIVLRVEGKGAHHGVAFGHTVLNVGASAQAVVVLDHVGSATLADNVEISVGANASLRLISIADWDRDAVQLQHHKARLDRDASLTHIAVTLGGDVVRQYTSVEFAGRGAQVDAYGIYFADAGQHLEHRLLMDHGVPDCRSNVGYRGALQGQDAHTVWVGDVLIRPEATGTQTYEINRNLVLTDGARADSVPNLEIQTGEVVSAGHASATGRFDDEQLFYLQARGIPEAEARRLVVRGFFAELVNKIGLPDIQDRLSSAIEARLAVRGV
ncbi:MAG: Fe-S cluster assembly protein SufD [Acidimicrobiales bacterium]|nr:MAG: Fe-S cluster assembly protein SufD [Acidimicrobiales bacterium]